jgi:subtilisin family serine protease/subtilisin-like proprotein convertase family protein
MMDSMPPISSDSLTLQSGVLPEYEGLLLQRGSDELLVDKMSDRFAVRLADGSIDELAQQIEAERVEVVPLLQLMEVTIDPLRLDEAMQTARASEGVAFASHIYQTRSSPYTLLYLTDQITVQFADWVDAEEMRAIATSAGLQIFKLVSGIPKTFVFQLTAQAVVNPIKLANRLLRRSDVVLAEPNIAVQSQWFYQPDAPDYPQQWYLNHDGGELLTAGSDIAVEAAWDVTRGVRSVVVAIADDGINLNHPDLQGTGKIVAPVDFSSGGFVPLPQDADASHGTSCARLAVAEENGTGMVGVAPGCALMPIRIGRMLDDQAIEQIAEWVVEKGADVLSCAWGAAAIDFPLSLRQRAALTRAATQGRNGKGCVLVFAAGNANRPIDGVMDEHDWMEDLVQGETHWLNGFAVHPDVIAVSASTSLGQKSACSNWGSALSIAAPGGDMSPRIDLQQTGSIATATPTAALRGRDVISTLSSDSPDYSVQQPAGTSSACAIVAGVAALVVSANPDLTARQVKHLLQTTADKLIQTDPDPQLGRCQGTYDPIGHSGWFGYGKVNAFKAVQMAQQTRRNTIRFPSRWLQQQNAELVKIPDHDLQGATSLIQINEVGILADIEVKVEVFHSFMGDLEIYLLPPNHSPVLLQNRTLGRLSILRATYSLRTIPVLRELLNQPVTGKWGLKLVDHAQLNTGHLEKWQIQLGVRDES